MGGDRGDVEGHRSIDDGDGHPTIDRRSRGAHGEARDTGITPQDGGAGL
jgi:hypothetical protein